MVGKMALRLEPAQELLATGRICAMIMFSHMRPTRCCWRNRYGTGKTLGRNLDPTLAASRLPLLVDTLFLSFDGKYEEIAYGQALKSNWENAKIWGAGWINAISTISQRQRIVSFSDALSLQLASIKY